MDTVRVTITKDEIFSVGAHIGRPGKPPTVFVAYRMNEPASIQFRGDLEEYLDQLAVSVTDGAIQDGNTAWADSIRQRIRDAKLFVADMTGPSREVLFEYGLAGNKPSLLVTEQPEHRDVLPGWISIAQMSPGFHGGGTYTIAVSISSLLRERSTGPRRPPVAPYSIAWIRGPGTTWAEDTMRKVQLLAQEYSVGFDVFDGEDIESWEELKDPLRSSLIVACIDGGAQGYLGHFLLGDIVARPKIENVADFHRQGFALLPEDLKADLVLAASVRRARGHKLAVVRPSQVPERVAEALSEVKRWRLDASSVEMDRE